jgi:glycine/D-amino acid oxidase-like deaminating enzyme
MKPRIVVIGAGAFGGWTALELVRRGALVTLVDAWGPGHARASSGGETRIIRAGYGERAIYTRMAARALERWRDHDAMFNTSLFTRTGALWLCGKGETFGESSATTLRQHQIAIERWTVAQARRVFSQIDYAGVGAVFFEPDAGYLLARRACEHVAERVAAEGGKYSQTAIAGPIALKTRRLTQLRQSDGSPIEADAFVFACGPWLASLFPDEIGSLLKPTRQEVYYFGVPPGDSRFQSPALPVWIEVGKSVMYGIPGQLNRGFKIADDSPGPPIDPTSGTRNITPSRLKAVQQFMAKRFPGLRSAPLVGAEVCQYEATPDSHFLIDRHPRADNVWIVGGGSGHGFKMGPVIGDIVARAVLGESVPDSTFALARFEKGASPAAKAKWR